jgi:hypothetical protein
LARDNGVGYRARLQSDRIWEEHCSGWQRSTELMVKILWQQRSVLHSSPPVCSTPILQRTPLQSSRVLHSNSPVYSTPILQRTPPFKTTMCEGRSCGFKRVKHLWYCPILPKVTTYEADSIRYCFQNGGFAWPLAILVIFGDIPQATKVMETSFLQN